ncbi:MAG: energy-coupling factor ABC transporter substrate-binding protein [Paenibacillus dendritiformis]|uniref:energy-coupling factor ABC transporter substrate-binding protein n=1 Tax=Paenibacillus dendritiformis TaxID=130049 RepID=UPI00143CEFA2|nr:energy-coupling factor ABC transporter substrate-binding protein [Paenibacillus dendritiformis]MDU5145991.1 energy-coupling factor ABC transporter substrate-binding protein [Paenibacillus dendritiformis]NKI23291.1 energy-coupling factor ABC transporter substrate-binding protein [Paenibacillus dendritiformis]NRF99333.1 energy-coupling factor ABC transporter substrate-binding protein [Paenibacillus dendritiformis]GIO76294.1 cobalt transport protein CbiN [Paenibacillus dendritiformis]
MKKININLILLLLVVILIASPFLLNRDAAYEGSDGEAEAAISEINPDYEPWFTPVYEPKSGEIESLLFTLQGCIGTGIIAYVIGVQRGRRKREHADH